MLYTILNKEAKAWWYHKQLRSQGQAGEARKRERQSIKSDISFLRALIQQKGFVRRCGDGTYHSSQLRESENCTYTREFGGYRHGQGLVDACISLGIKVEE